MRNDSLKSAIVIALSACLTAAETFAIATTPSTSPPSAVARTVATIDGRLEAGATALHPVPVEAGRAYHVRVEAAAPGADIDLQLFSPAGHELARAFGTASHPSVAAVASGRDPHEVDVTMARCPAETCAYRLVVVSK